MLVDLVQDEEPHDEETNPLDEHAHVEEISYDRDENHKPGDKGEQPNNAC